MAAGAGPTQRFSFVYRVGDNGNGSYRVIERVTTAPSQTLSDVPDPGVNDVPGILGDVPNDTFTTNDLNAPTPFTYVATPVLGSGVVGRSASVNATFLFSDDPIGDGTNVRVTSTPYVLVCYVTGTLIRVLRDGAETDVPVEALSVGELAVTASGEHRPIRWIGSRTLDPRRHPRPHEAMPVRIRAHALGDNRPARDLVVSPGHSIAVDVCGQVLIPVSALVDGVSVVQERVARVTYWHVELDGHDLLIAENQPAESYLDMGNRGFFAGEDVIALHAGPDADPSLRTHASFCRPFHAAGPVVELVRARLAARADEGRRASPGLRQAG